MPRLPVGCNLPCRIAPLNPAFLDTLRTHSYPQQADDFSGLYARRDRGLKTLPRGVLEA